MQQLREGVWHVECYGLPNWTVNAYLVNDDGMLTLVDAGLPWNTRTVQHALQQLDYAVDDIDRVLLTHYDLDHFGGLLRLDIDADIYVGTGEHAYFSGTATPPVLHHKGPVHRTLMKLLPSLETTPLDDGDTIGGFTAYSAPGHNPGHTVYMHDELSAAFLGDAVRAENGELRPPVFWDNYNRETVTKTILSLADQLPDFELACPGHGTPITEHGSAALQELANAVGKNQSLTQRVKQQLPQR